MLSPVSVIQSRYAALQARAPQLEAERQQADDDSFRSTWACERAQPEMEACWAGVLGGGGLGAGALALSLNCPGPPALFPMVVAAGLLGVAAVCLYQAVRQTFPTHAMRTARAEAVQKKRQAWVTLRGAQGALEGCRRELKQLGELARVAALAPVAGGSGVAETSQAVTLGGVRLRKAQLD